MKKLLILSGKGGTGKTTTALAFINFGKIKAIADCDVDAPNLHIINKMNTEPIKSDFIGSKKASIDNSKCIGCKKCIEYCRFNAIENINGKMNIIDYACEGCGVCEYICPANAISLKDDIAGEQSLYIDSNENVFSTAKLKMGRGNSGKLVTNVKLAMLKNAPDCDVAIIDGSPGIGCPVIASISGVDMVLVVAEPSLSGISDLKRLIKSCKSFDTKIAICVNKYDTSIENTQKIIDFCKSNELNFVGTVPYDKNVSVAVNEGKSIVEYNCEATKALKNIYDKTMNVLLK